MNTIEAFASFHCKPGVPIEIREHDAKPSVKLGRLSELGGAVYFDNRKDLERLRDKINEYLTRGPNDIPF